MFNQTFVRHNDRAAHLKMFIKCSISACIFSIKSKTQLEMKLTTENHWMKSERVCTVVLIQFQACFLNDETLGILAPINPHLLAVHRYIDKHNLTPSIELERVGGSWGETSEGCLN